MAQFPGGTICLFLRPNAGINAIGIANNIAIGFLMPSSLPKRTPCRCPLNNNSNNSTSIQTMRKTGQNRISLPCVGVCIQALENVDSMEGAKCFGVRPSVLVYNVGGLEPSHSKAFGLQLKNRKFKLPVHGDITPG